MFERPKCKASLCRHKAQAAIGEELMAELIVAHILELANRLKCCLMDLSRRLSALTLAVLVPGVAAFAAGSAPVVVPAGHELVQCISVDGDTALDILFQIEEDRYRAVWMVASDPTVSVANTEIARFEADEGLLVNSDTLVVAHVDPKNPKTGRKGERIGGTVLGALTKITLDIDVDLFAVNSSSAAAEAVTVPSRFSAQATYFKRNGDQFDQDFDCSGRR